MGQRNPPRAFVLNFLSIVKKDPYPFRKLPDSVTVSPEGLLRGGRYTSLPCPYACGKIVRGPQGVIQHIKFCVKRPGEQAA